MRIQSGLNARQRVCAPAHSDDSRQKADQEAQKARRASYLRRVFSLKVGWSRRDHDPSPSERGNRRPPRGPGHVQHSLQSAVMSLPIHQGGGSDPSPGLGYCIQQMTRLERDLQGMLNTLKIGGDDSWRQGKQKNPSSPHPPAKEQLRQFCIFLRHIYLVMLKKTQPLCGAGCILKL